MTCPRLAASAILLGLFIVSGGAASSSAREVGAPAPKTLFDMLHADEVVSELKLTTEQTRQLRELGKRFQDEQDRALQGLASEYAAALRGGVIASDFLKLQGRFVPRAVAAQQEVLRRYSPQINGILTAVQRQRGEELIVQANWLTRFKNPEFTRRLKLTPEQQMKISALDGKLSESIFTFARQALQRDPDEVSQAQEQIRANYELQCEDLLTPSQREELDALQGAPFRFGKVFPFAIHP